MKRSHDGSIRRNVGDETRARALATLKVLICPILFQTVANQSTDNLLALIAKVRPEAVMDEPDAGSE